MGGASASPWKGAKKKSHSQREWEDLGRKVEQKFMHEVKSWASQTKTDGEAAEGDGADAQDRSRAALDEEWKEIGQMVEKKIKRKIRTWAEEE